MTAKDRIRLSAGKGARSLSYAWSALAVLLFLLVLNSIANSSLVAPSNWASTLAAMSPFIFVSMAQVPAVMSGDGGLDLSVGPVAALVGAIVVGRLVPHGIDSGAAVIPIGLGVGLAVGLVNGFFIVYVRIPAIATTLGTYLITSALATEILPTPGGHAPGWLANVSSSTILGLPEVFIVLVVIELGWIFLHRTAFRRNLLAVGGDARAAYTSGVNVAKVRMLAYALTGILAAAAGLVLVSVLNSGDPSVGPEYTIISLTGAALGGVTLAGGRGGLLGAAAGGATLYLLQSLLAALNVSVFYTDMAFGIALLCALAANRYADIRRRRAHIGGMLTMPTARDDAQAGVVRLGTDQRPTPS